MNHKKVLLRSVVHSSIEPVAQKSMIITN